MLLERDLGYLEDLREYGRRAMAHAAKTTYAEFLELPEIRDGILHCVTMVGEVTRRLSPAVAAELPQFDWRGMRDMRNFIVHEYDRLDLDRVWEVIQRDLPPLVDELTRYLAQFP